MFVLTTISFLVGWLVLDAVREFALVRGMYIEHMIIVVLYGVSYLNYLDRLVLLSFRDSLRDVFNLTLVIIQSVSKCE